MAANFATSLLPGDGGQLRKLEWVAMGGVGLLFEVPFLRWRELEWARCTRVREALTLPKVWVS